MIKADDVFGYMNNMVEQVLHKKKQKYVLNNSKTQQQQQDNNSSNNNRRSKPVKVEKSGHDP